MKSLEQQSKEYRKMVRERKICEERKRPSDRLKERLLKMIGKNDW